MTINCSKTIDKTPELVPSLFIFSLYTRMLKMKLLTYLNSTFLILLVTKVYGCK